MNVRKNHAIVLRSIKYSNTSKIVTFFTEDFGKVAVVAKGARRIKSKFGAGLEPFLVSEIIYYHRAERSLQILTDADIIIPFKDLRNDLVKRVYAYAVCELLNRMTEDRNSDLFNLTVDYLRLLELIPQKSVVALFWSFQLKMYSLLGFRPHLLNCSECGVAFGASNVRLVLKAGGVVCRFCAGDDAFAETLSLGTLRLLARLLMEAPGAISRYQISSKQEEEGSCFFDYYLRYYSGSDRQLVSLQSLRDLTVMEA